MDKEVRGHGCSVDKDVLCQLGLPADPATDPDLARAGTRIDLDLLAGTGVG